MFKLSWGTITAIFYCSFVVFILVLVYMATKQKFELVTPNYYAEELKYQHKIDAAGNTQLLSEPTQVSVQANGILIDFPKDFDGKQITGQITLLRPSDETKDIKVAINADQSGKQLVTSSNFQKGLYSLRVDWKCDGKDYFLEKNIFF